jgi:signal transduction histidine kinase
MNADQLIIAGVAVLTCCVTGALAFLALRLARRASIGVQVIIAVLAPTIAVAAAIAINVRLMFISAHDSAVMILALSVSSVLAAGLALLVSRRIVAGTARLTAGLSQLSEAPPSRHRAPDQADEQQRLPAELAHLLAELDSTRSRLAEARDREQAAQHARQQLVQHLSHDLRTPLAGLRALAEALEDDMITDVPQAMRQIRATVARMDSLVGDLFELSRVQGGPPERTHQLLSVTELITDLGEEAESTARRAGVRLIVEVPDSDRLAISGDADDLGRALGNLISNAIRHTAPDNDELRRPGTPADRPPTVAIRAWRSEDGGVSVAVVDRCGGIPEAELSRVFEAGWRGDLSRSTPDGAGLGLTIARGVVESHRGRIAVSNQTDGCRFDVELPAPAQVSR